MRSWCELRVVENAGEASLYLVMVRITIFSNGITITDGEGLPGDTGQAGKFYIIFPYYTGGHIS